MDYRKMIVAAGALVCASTLLGVESANVVGYQNVTNTASQKCYNGSTFYKIAEGKLTLGEVGVDAKFSACSDTLTILNQYGGIKGMYYYVDQANIDIMKDYFVDSSKAVVGWYDADLYDNWDWESDLPNANSETLEDGEAVMLQVGVDGAAIVVSGGVDTEDINLECDAGKKSFRCNCTPVDITLGDIVANSAFSACSDTLTILNQYGGIKNMYYYVDQANIDIMKDYFVDSSKAVVGWYDADLYDNWDWESDLPNANAVAVPSASGFMIQVGTNKAGVIIPSAL